MRRGSRLVLIVEIWTVPCLCYLINSLVDEERKIIYITKTKNIHKLKVAVRKVSLYRLFVF